MLDSVETFVPLCLSALIAGVINSLAGGGTLLTFPALLVVLSPLGAGEAAVVANATNTVALVPGSLAGAWGYRRKILETKRWLLLLIGPSLAGGVVGSLLVTRLDPAYFARAVPWLLLLAAVLFLVDTLMPRKASVGAEPRMATGRGTIGLMLFQFAVSVYGGYFGAGMGILMLSALALIGTGDMHRMNALKTLLSGLINGISAVVFAVEGKVAWQYVLPMAAAAVLGGYLGARAALRVQPRTVRWLVIAIGFGLTAYFFLRA